MLQFYPIIFHISLSLSLRRRYDDDASLFEIGKNNIAREREIITSCRDNGRERYSLYRHIQSRSLYGEMSTVVFAWVSIDDDVSIRVDG